jgi:tetratricopeptide (TPR) repeat protein
MAPRVVSTTKSLKALKSVLWDAEKVPVLTLLFIAEACKWTGKWRIARRLSTFALNRVKGEGTKTEGLALLSVGHAHWGKDNWSDAIYYLRQAKAILEGLSAGPYQAYYLMRSMLLLGDSLLHFEGADEAEDLAKEAEQLLKKYPSQFGKVKTIKMIWLGKWSDFYMDSMIELGEIYYYTDCWVEGEKLLREILPMLESKRGWRDATTIEAQRDLASMLVNQNKYSEAEAAYRRAREWNRKVPVFGHEEEAAINYNVAMCLSEQGNFEEAKEELSQMDLAADLLHYANGDWTLKLARFTHLRLGENQQVVYLCRRFDLVLEEKFGVSDLATIRNLEDYAIASSNLQQHEESIEILRDVKRRVDLDVSWRPGPRLRLRMTLAHVLGIASENDESIYEHRKCLESARTEEPKVGIMARRALRCLGVLYERIGDKHNAMIAYSQLQREYWSLPPTDANLLDYYVYRGKMFVLEGKLGRAAELLKLARQTKAKMELEALEQLKEGDDSTEIEEDEEREDEQQGGGQDAIPTAGEIPNIVATEDQPEIGDELERMMAENPFQLPIPIEIYETEPELDYGSSPTIDALLSHTEHYPLAPSTDEWQQPEFPQLPSTYEETKRPPSLKENSLWER